MNTHITKKKNEETGRRFVYSYILFDEYGVDNCKIELIEACPCNSIDELRKRETHYIQTIPNINNHHNWTPERIEEVKLKKKQKSREAYHKKKLQQLEMDHKAAS